MFASNTRPSCAIRFSSLVLAACWCSAHVPEAQAVIEEGLQVGIRDFAVLPNTGSGSNAPARVNLMTADPLGRLFVNDQRGPLYTVSDDGSTVTNYLDLSTFSGMSLTTSTGEQGFQSFTFHPDFATQGTDGFGKFYTIHSTTDGTPAPTYPFVSNTGTGSNNTHDTLLLEWTVSDPNAATYAAGGGTAPREVFRLEQPRTNHNAGLIAFNPSVSSGDSDYGNLYIAIGDGGSGNDPWDISEDPNKPYGKILRIDPLDPDGAGGADYGIVGDNFFASDSDTSTLPEIYAYGLRNPQRFGWDTVTGTMYAADIGQNAWEEINLIVNGGNYGWDDEEGNSNPLDASLEDPIAQYNHTIGGDVPLIPGASEGSRAITMGEVVRGSSVPGLNGLLLSGNFPSGAALYIDVSAGPPAQRSGVDPFEELIFVDVDGTGLPVDLLELVNDTRAANFISSTSRTDLRWSIGTDGRVFATNKRDGVIRELVAVQPGDFDLDGDVDGFDFLVWQRGESPLPLSQSDLATWQANYGQSFPVSTNGLPVPEPGTLVLLLSGSLAAISSRRPRGPRR